MAESIPDLEHYSQGLGTSTFPLQIESIADSYDRHSVHFTIVTLENFTCLINLNGQGFSITSYSCSESSGNMPLASSEPSPDLILSPRQKEALTGMVYETVEALLMAISPGFEEFFGQELTRKLNNISWDRFQRQDDGDGDVNDEHYGNS